MIDKAFCINLDRRPDRWKGFCTQNWPWPVQRFAAWDAAVSQAPSWWKQGNGAWGCFQSHTTILNMAMRAKWKNVLIMEDDAWKVDDFDRRWKSALADVPDDWDMLYLGGLHLIEAKDRPAPDNKWPPPERVTDHVLRGNNINLCHAVAFRDKAIPAILQQVWETAGSLRDRRQHIDYCLGSMHPRFKTYAIHPWLIRQKPFSDYSEIAGRVLEGGRACVNVREDQIVDKRPNSGLLVVALGGAKAPCRTLLEAMRALGWDGCLDGGLPFINPDDWTTSIADLRKVLTKSAAMTPFVLWHPKAHHNPKAFKSALPNGVLLAYNEGEYPIRLDSDTSSEALLLQIIHAVGKPVPAAAAKKALEILDVATGKYRVVVPTRRCDAIEGEASQRCEEPGSGVGVDRAGFDVDGGPASDSGVQEDRQPPSP